MVTESVRDVAAGPTELGRSAVRLLLAEITDRTTHRHRAVVFPPELIVRESAP